MKKFSKWMVGLIGGLVALIVIVLVVPFLIDFNQFKPQIQQIVSDNVNAKLDFQSARLQILPGLGVKITKVTIENTDATFAGTRLFAVDEIFFQTELFPLFKKQFKGEILIDKPDIIMATKGLKNNLASLAKPKAPGEDTKKAPEPAKPPTDKKAQADLMAMIKESVVLKSLKIKTASLRIQKLGEEKTREPVKVSDFNLIVENIGLERDIKTEISTLAKVAEAGARVSGPIKITMLNNIKMAGDELELATFSGKVDLDGLDINAMDAFVKPPGTALNLLFKGQLTPKTLDVDDLAFNLHNLAVTGKIAVKDLKTLLTEAEVKVRNDDLVKLGELLPKHKNLLQNATIKLDAGVSGPLSDYKKVKATLDFATKLTGSDFSTNLRVDSIEPVKLQLAANSTRLDIGAILKPFMPPEDPNKPAAAKPSPVSPAPSGTAQQSPEAQAPEKEFELTPEQKSLLAGADIQVDVSLKEIIFDKINLKNFLIRAKQESLKARLDELSVNGFGGTVRTKGLVDLGSSPISFQNDFNIVEVQADQFIELIKPEHKDLLKGKLSLNLAAHGKGTTRTGLSKTLNAKGGFSVKDGELNTTSVAGTMQTEFDKFVGGLSIAAAGESAFAAAEKILSNPLLKNVPGQKPDLSKFKSQYASIKNVKLADKAATDKSLKDVKGELEVKDGRIYITSKKPGPAGLMDFNGSVGIDSTLAGKAIFTASESTKGNLVKQSPYASLLFDGNKNLILAMNLSGMVDDPKVSLDLSAMKQSFEANAKALVTKEVQKAADDYAGKILKGQKDAVLGELKKKQDELKAQADQKINEQKQRADAEKKKAEDDAKKKAKDKLKGLFGK